MSQIHWQVLYAILVAQKIAELFNSTSPTTQIYDAQCIQCTLPIKFVMHGDDFAIQLLCNNHHVCHWPQMSFGVKRLEQLHTSIYFYTYFSFSYEITYPRQTST